MVRIHLSPARSQQRTLWLPGASHAGGTQSSNPLCSSAESATNLVAAGGVARGWDPEFESALLQRGVKSEPGFLFNGS
jgi:hypothetical protein